MQQFLVLGESNNGNGNSLKEEFKPAASAIFGGLRAFNVMSTTGRASGMASAREIIKGSYADRQNLFSVAEIKEFEGWVQNNRHFRNLLEDPPPSQHHHVQKKEKSVRNEARKINININPVADKLLGTGKLCLVLDIDHTLLHSVMFSEVDPPLKRWILTKIEAEKSFPPEHRAFFQLESIQMFTKLRPGVRDFLYRAAKLFELWIHTNGNSSYASAVVPLLDPAGVYFQGRIIAQGAERLEEMVADQPKALAHGLELRQPITVVVDDSHAVWQAHSDSLCPVERYLYFPSNRTPPPLRGSTLLERNQDEDPKKGNLMITLQVLENLHKSVFDALYQSATDQKWAPVMEVLSRKRKQVLQGVHVVFSKVIPLGQDPKTHELWQLAESFGAKCSDRLTNATTHLVSRDPGTEKAMQARAARIFVVTPVWLTGSCYGWKRLNEEGFQI